MVQKKLARLRKVPLLLKKRAKKLLLRVIAILFIIVILIFVTNGEQGAATPVVVDRTFPPKGGIRRNTIFFLPSDLSIDREKYKTVTTGADVGVSKGSKLKGCPAPCKQHVSRKAPPPGSIDLQALEIDLETAIHQQLVERGHTKDYVHRVRFLTKANRFDVSHCNLQASAALSGVKLTSMGYNTKYHEMDKLKTVMDFVVQEQLEDEDVLVWMDSDVVMTGRDAVPFFVDFILHSAACEEDLDVAAVRAWEDYGPENASKVLRSMKARDGADQWQYPPMLTNVENTCYFPQYMDEGVSNNFSFIVDELVSMNREGIGGNRAQLWERAKERLTTGPDPLLTVKQFNEGEKHAPLNFRGSLKKGQAQEELGREKRTSSGSVYRDGVDPPPPLPRQKEPRCLNSGVYVARVWAVKQLAAAFTRLRKGVEPMNKRSKRFSWFSDGFHCDQSIVSMIYYTQKIWEVEHDLLSAPPPSSTDPVHPPSGARGSGSKHQRWLPVLDIPAGMMGIDKRESVFFVNVTLSLDGTRLSPNTVYPRPQRELPEYLPTKLRVSRSGALLGIPVREEEVPLMWHFAGAFKDFRSEMAQFTFEWWVASRFSPVAQEVNTDVLKRFSMELRSGSTVYHARYTNVCGVPLP